MNAIVASPSPRGRAAPVPSMAARSRGSVPFMGSLSPRKSIADAAVLLPPSPPCPPLPIRGEEEEVLQWMLVQPTQGALPVP